MAIVTLVAHGSVAAPARAAAADAAADAGGAGGGVVIDEGARDTERYAIRAEAGAEYDSNPHRTEALSDEGAPPTTPSPLARLVLTGTISDEMTARQDAWATVTAATKLFTDAGARDEDVLVAESGAGWRLRLGARTALSASGAYYEAFQRDAGASANLTQRRDFRSLAGGLRLARVLGPTVEAGVGAGYRAFVFKPDRDFDFHGPTAGLDLRWSPRATDGAPEWDVAAGALYEHRSFAGPALIPACAVDPTTMMELCLPEPGDRLRADEFLVARAEVTRTGVVMVGAGYGVQYNASNSFSETALRHFVTARFAAELPLRVFLTARAELLFARYPDGTFVARASSAGRPFASIEDENRSSVRADLSRNLTDRLQVIARYTFYGPALSGTPVAYRRQTALLSLAFTLEK